MIIFLVNSSLTVEKLDIFFLKGILYCRRATLTINSQHFSPEK